MIEQFGCGGKKVNRVNVSLTNKVNTKLCRLATACNMKPTTLAGLLIEMSLDNTRLVEELQKEYAIHTAYRVLPVKNYKTNEIEYILNEK